MPEMFDASPRCPRLDLKAPRWGKLGGGDWRRREGQPYTINSKISCCTRIQHYFLVSCPDELSLVHNARSMSIVIPSSGTNDSTDSIIISYSDDQSFQHNDVEPFTPCIAIRTSRRR